MGPLSCPVMSCPVCPICDVGVLWPNGCMNQDETWYSGRPRFRPHCVRWGPSYRYGKGHSSPYTFENYGRRLCVHIIVGPCLSWPHGWMDHDETWHGLGHIVLDGDSAPPPQRGRALKKTHPSVAGEKRP